MTDTAPRRAAILKLSARYNSAPPVDDGVETPDLSALDIRLLQMAGEGFVDKQIAEKLTQEPDRVHERWRRIRRALGAKNRSHAVAIALALGLIAAPAQARMILARKR